jgi:hypothetical protein
LFLLLCILNLFWNLNFYFLCSRDLLPLSLFLS